MNATDSATPLESLPFVPYLDASGNILAEFAGKIGVYAIFNADKSLEYVGISRDIATSMKLHLVRVPDRCCWVKVATVEKPNRTLLSAIQTNWMDGKVLDPAMQERWDQPLNCQKLMTDAERQQLAEALSEGEQEKILKNVARRVEKEILEHLTARGIGFEVRFNPKLKSAGILDVK